MKRWFPYPLLSLLLLASWLALNQTLAPVHVLLGAILGIGGGLALAELQEPSGRAQRAGKMIELAWLVLDDIVRSNIAVARIVLGGKRLKRVSGFVSLPLEIRHPGALAVLACIVTATPGTSWARYERAPNRLTIHIFDLIDADEWIHTFRERYERRLQEIFE